MKNRIIAIVLTLVLALGSTGITQVHAADAAGQEDAPAQKEETAEQAEVIDENASEGHYQALLQFRGHTSYA